MDQRNLTATPAIRVGSLSSNHLFVLATTLLIIAAILGPALSGIRLGSFHLFLFRLYLPVYALILGWLVWSGRLKIKPVPTTWWLLIAFGGWVTASAIWTTSVTGAISRLGIILPGLFVATAVTFTTFHRDTLARYVFVVAALAVISCLVATWEIMTGMHLFTSRLSTAAYSDVPSPLGVDVASTWFYNRNNYMFFLGLIAGPLFAYMLDSERRAVSRIFIVGMFVVIAIFGWINGSRLTGLMLAGALISITFLTALRPWLRNQVLVRHGRAIVTTLVFCAAIVSVVIFTFVPNPFNQPWLSPWIRWQLGIESVEMFYNTNGLGVGVGSFTTVIDPAGPKEIVSPHNWLFYLLGEFGILGTALFLAAYAQLLYDLGSSFLSTGETLQIGLFGTMVALPIGALGPSNAVLVQEFWLFIGFAAAAAYRI